VLHYAHDPSKVQAWGGGCVNCWVGITSHIVVPQDEASLDFLTAASVLFRRRALEEVGLFDETFFLYWEDTDLSFRLRARGWKLGVAADAIVLHKENASSGSRRTVDRFSTASGIRFLRKYSPVPMLSVPLFLCMRILVRMFRGEFRQVSDIVGGLRDYLRSRAHLSRDGQ
jgi:GT2 family glycosyltransferase